MATGPTSPTTAGRGLAYEPWGWAPYHYGRWFPYGGAWAWWPGPVYAGYNPFWSPAYVSFFGWGRRLWFRRRLRRLGRLWLASDRTVRLVPSMVGWIPRPLRVVGFRGGFHRFGGFAPLHGGTRFSNIANIHDDHIGRALSTVNAGRFGAGRVTAVAASREQINGARMMAGNLPVVPSRASFSASGRAAAPSTVRNGGSQRFFGSTHNNVARPASFQRRRQACGRRCSRAMWARFLRAAASESQRVEETASMQKPSAGIQGTRKRETRKP